MKYFIINLGCQMNLADSERIQAVFNSLGLQKTEIEEEAQLVGVVACSVRQKAIDRIYSKIHEWNEKKQNTNLITFLSGCVLPADADKFLKKFDLLFTIKELPKLPELLTQYGVVTPLSLAPSEVLNALETPKDSMGNFWKIRPLYSNNYEASIPIQNGCDKFCTYCAVPYTRGREISRPSKDILQEIESLVNQGYKSFTLLGQNVNSYGKDKPGEELEFPELLAQIGELGIRSGKFFWVYFTSPHPKDMTERVLHTIAKYPVLAKQIHLPLQSGDNDVLKRMNRNHDIAWYRKIVEQVWTILPQATIFTDIIVGFTGETWEQFENSIKAMKEFKYQMAYIALYSPRPGAASARWDDDVPLDEKKRRFRILTNALLENSLQYNLTQVGKTVKVFVDRPDRKKGYYSGHTEGRVLVRFASELPDLVGTFVDLKIISVVPLSMEGVLV